MVPSVTDTVITEKAESLGGRDAPSGMCVAAQVNTHIGQYHLKSGVFVALDDETAVILNLSQDSYELCNPAGTEMLRAMLTDFLPDARVDFLVSRLGQSPETIANDLGRFEADCLARGLISYSEDAARRPKYHCRQKVAGWLVPKAVWTLLLVWYYFKSGSLKETYDAVGGITRSRFSPSDDTVLRAVRAFTIAEGIFPLRAQTRERDCLYRSLALFKYLHTIGINCRHHIGIRRTPFGAHAWVEIEGRNHLEGNPKETYSTIAQM